MTGTLSFGYTRLPDDYKPAQSFIDRLTAYAFSEKIVQYNCPTCGAFVLCSTKLDKVDGKEQELEWGVMTGALEKLDGIIEITRHIFVEDTKDGGFADLLPTWHGRTIPRRKHREGDVPLGWRSASIDASKSSDKLHAHCKCGGVQFWIQRPAKASNNGKPRPAPTSSGEMCSPALAAWVRNDRQMYLACNCVCNSCRKATGLDVTQYAYIGTADISLNEAGTERWKPVFGTLKAYTSSQGRTRTFCSVCGAMTFFISAERNDVVDVGVGLFDAAEGARAESWIEWRLERFGFPEDTKGRADSLAEAMTHGFRQFREAHPVI